MSSEADAGLLKTTTDVDTTSQRRRPHRLDSSTPLPPPERTQFEELKHKIHSTRIPLSPRGRAVMVVIYLVSPILVGSYIMSLANRYAQQHVPSQIQSDTQNIKNVQKYLNTIINEDNKNTENPVYSDKKLNILNIIYIYIYNYL